MRLKLGMIAICFGVVSMPLLAQKAKKVKAPPKDPQDQIEIVGHVALSGGSVKRFLPTQHYSSYYLYVEYQTGNSVTLLDVTRPKDPLVLASIPLPTTGGSASLFAVAGTSGLITDQAASARSVSPPETIRVMDFSDLRNPKIAREFTGVTAIQPDERRGLVFVAASDGLWILQEHLATDPGIERAYDYYVRYGASMYPPPK